jgi:SagB-type dehydrogenase family enzyme
MSQFAGQFDYIQTQLRQTESQASLFHEQSKTRPNVLYTPPVQFDPAVLPDFSRSAFKEYRLAPRISLPETEPIPVSLDRLILQRRSVRRFTNETVRLEEAAAQLALSYRVKKTEPPYRPVPSGGALFPLELYLASVNMEGLDQGLYHYHPAYHELERLSAEPPLPALRHSLLPDTLPAGAAYIFCICGVLPRNRFKYGELGYRLMLLEAGHLAQNILLVAEAQRLGGMPVCGFYDDRMHDFLEVDGVDEVCLYLLIIGRPHLS